MSCISPSDALWDSAGFAPREAPISAQMTSEEDVYNTVAFQYWRRALHLRELHKQHVLDGVYLPHDCAWCAGEEPPSRDIWDSNRQGEEL